MGNMNIHMNDSADNDAIIMSVLPDSFIPMNNILVPTYRLQNTPDVVLTDTTYTGIS